MPERQIGDARMRSGLAGAVIVAACAVVLVGVLWLTAREAPSAGRDPLMTPLALVPTRVPTPTPATASPEADQ